MSERTCSKWVSRYRAEGPAGLLDRSSAPRSVPHRTSEQLVEAIVLLRRLRMTAAEIAGCLPIALSTVSAVLSRVGLGKLSRLEPPEPPNRYQRRHPGELVHIDVKKLARIPEWGAGHRVHGNRRLQRMWSRTNAAGQRERLVGWECVHVCVDDATRLAYVEVLPDEKAITAAGFLQRAIAFYRPRTNGKAERFIRTLIAGWAYGAIYGSSRERTAALDGWLWNYNHRRPHGSLSHQPPIARLNELNNVARSYT